MLQPKRYDVVRKRGGYVFRCRGSNCKSRSIRFSQIKEYCAILIHIFPQLRVLASGNDTLSHFTISKRYFINYAIPFYNTPNIPKFYFTILHIKIIYLRNKIYFFLFFQFSPPPSLNLYHCAFTAQSPPPRLHHAHHTTTAHCPPKSHRNKNLY